MSGIYSIIGSALSAQNQRMSAISSNLANADTVTMPGQQPYRAREEVFQAEDLPDGSINSSFGGSKLSDQVGVEDVGTVESNAPVHQTYDPGSPYANADGYVETSNVDTSQQMVDMIDSSNSYQADIAVLTQSTKIDQDLIQDFQVG